MENKHYKNLEINDETYYDTRYIDCTFEDCKFERVKLETCELLDCEFINCTFINISSENSDLKSATILKSNIIGLNFSDFSSDLYSYASPIYKMNDSFIKYGMFIGTNLSKVDLKDNHFDECLFDDCNLVDAQFNNCEMRNTQITNSNLERADFRGAQDYYIDLKSNKLKDAYFTFPEVSNLLKSLDINID